MHSLEQLRGAFRQGLGLSATAAVDEIEYRKIAEWDSVAHMQLVMEIEATFDVMLSTEDVLALSSFRAARDILGAHGVAFS